VVNLGRFGLRYLLPIFLFLSVAWAGSFKYGMTTAESYQSDTISFSLENKYGDTLSLIGTSDAVSQNYDIGFVTANRSLLNVYFGSDYLKGTTKTGFVGIDYSSNLISDNDLYDELQADYTVGYEFFSTRYLSTKIVDSGQVLTSALALSKMVGSLSFSGSYYQYASESLLASEDQLIINSIKPGMLIEFMSLPKITTTLDVSFYPFDNWEIYYSLYGVKDLNNKLSNSNTVGIAFSFWDDCLIDISSESASNVNYTTYSLKRYF